MRAEHAAVDVRFVDDDVAEVCEYVAPAVVVRQQADVHHVGVRQDHVRPLADLPTLLGRRVAVVDRRLQPRQLQLGQRAELILRERLRRIEVERAGLRLARDGVEDGQVERERLPGRGAGRHEHVVAPRRGVPRLALVRVEPVDADRVAHARVETVRQVGKPGLARGLLAQVGELLALEQPLPAQDVDAHASIVEGCLEAPGAARFGPPGCLVGG